MYVASCCRFLAKDSKIMANKDRLDMITQSNRHNALDGQQGGNAMVCLQCGKSFTGHKRKWCSKECRLKEGHIRSKKHQHICPKCNKTFKSASTKQIYCSVLCSNRVKNEAISERTNPEVRCDYCGIEFKPRVNLYNKYCSRECAFKHKSRFKVDRVWMRKMAIAFRVNIQKEELVDCVDCGCGIIVAVPGGQALRCEQCRRRLAVEQQHYRRTGNVKSWKCDMCGKPKPSQANYYCEKCRAEVKIVARRIQKRKRKLKLRKMPRQSYTPTRIANRDKWKCGICGLRIDAVLKYPHPRSLSIDHVKPISRGGTDKRNNVQPAHLDCNMKKGAKLYEQGILFA